MRVDLNPIRAGAAGTSAKSDFTSIQERIGETGYAHRFSLFLKPKLPLLPLRLRNV